MVVSIIGSIIGILVAAFGIYYLIKEKDDKESRKIYGIISGVGAAVFIGTIIRLIVLLLQG